jgi:hypothetical protein
MIQCPSADSVYQYPVVVWHHIQASEDMSAVWAMAEGVTFSRAVSIMRRLDEDPGVTGSTFFRQLVFGADHRAEGDAGHTCWQA